MANNSILTKVKPRRFIIISITTSLMTASLLVISEVILDLGNRAIACDGCLSSGII